jgi:hypothetical protein
LRQFLKVHFGYRDEEGSGHGGAESRQRCQTSPWRQCLFEPIVFRASSIPVNGEPPGAPR